MTAPEPYPLPEATDSHAARLGEEVTILREQLHAEIKAHARTRAEKAALAEAFERLKGELGFGR